MKIEPQPEMLEQPAAKRRADGDPEATTADHRAIARARSGWLVKTLVRIDTVAGMIAAAPIPISTRQAMRFPADPEAAASADPSPKTSRPPARVRSSDPVSEAAHGKQQSGHGQGVGVDDPLQGGG